MTSIGPDSRPRPDAGDPRDPAARAGEPDVQPPETVHRADHDAARRADTDRGADDADRDRPEDLWPQAPPGSAPGARTWWRRVAGALAVGVVTLFLLQLVRVLLPLAGFALPANGVGAGGVARALLLPAALSLLAPVWPRLVGARFTVWGAAALVALLRLVELVVDTPGTDRWLATFGIAAGVWALSALLATTQDTFGHGIALALTADAAIRGVGWTVDLSWQGTSEATWLVLGLVVLLGAAAWLTTTDAANAGVASGPDASASLPLLALGPLLFLELLILQNQGWVATATGWSWGAAFLLIGAGNGLGILGTSVGRTMPGQNATGLIGGVLLLLVTVRVGLGGALAALLFLAAHLGAGMVIGAVTAPVPPHRNTRGTVAHGVMLALAAALFAGFVLAFEQPAGLSAPVPQELLVVLAGALVVLLGLGASVSPRSVTRPQWPVVVLGLALLAVPVQWVRTHDDPEGQAEGEGLPRRVATYDAGFAMGPAGTPDLEAVAAVIEDTGATVVGLQDLPRGRLLSGSIDAVGWLQRRLDFPYAAFHAPNEALWGDAILSRLPLDRVDGETLPQGGSSRARGVLAADVEAGGGVTLRFLVTQLADLEEPGELHAEQMERIVEVWDEDQRTVVLGNLNAPGGTPATDVVTQAGFLDGWAYAGEPPGFTTPADDPQQRVDWIFHTDDLRVYNAEVIDAGGSDHLAVAATVRAGPQPENSEDAGDAEG